MNKLEKSVIVVLGMHRSGTSMVSSFVHSLLPAQQNKLLPPSADNPEGFWEDIDVIALNVDVLKFMGASWDSLQGFKPTKSDLKKLDQNFGERVRNLIESRLDKHDCWSFKDPRTTKLLAFWCQQLQKCEVSTKLIFCNRSPLAVAHSLHKRNKLPLEHGLTLYSLYMYTAVPHIHEHQSYIVNYEACFEENDQQLYELAKFLGIADELAIEKQIGFRLQYLKPKLNHESRHKRQKLMSPLAFNWHAYIAVLKVGDLSKKELELKLQACTVLADATINVAGLAQQYLDLAENNAKLTVLEREKLAALKKEEQKLLADIKKIQASVNDQKKSILYYQDELSKAANEKLIALDFQKQLNESINILESTISKDNQEKQNLITEQKKLAVDNKELLGGQHKLEADIRMSAKKYASERQAFLVELEKLADDVQTQVQSVNELNIALELSQSKINELEDDRVQHLENHAGLLADVDGLKQALVILREEKDLAITQLQSELVNLEKLEKELHSNISGLQDQVKQLTVENLHYHEVEKHLVAEVGRIWDIVEKYRLAQVATQVELDNVYGSVSWKLTYLLREANRIFRQVLPSTSYRIMKLTARTILSIFPEKMNVVERVRLLKARFLSGLKGEADSNSNKASLHDLFRHRQNVSACLAIKTVSTADLPEIDISLVSYNNGQYIKAFLESLLVQNYPLEKLNIIVVDNSSTDNTMSIWRDVVEEHDSTFSSFKLFSRENLGFGAGHDFAIKNSHSEFLLVANIDLEFLLDSLEKVVSFAMHDGKETATWELRQKPYEHPKYYDPVSLETGWSSHACILVRRQAYEAIGGYDDNIFMYGEDVEISYRFRDRGYLLKYVPSAVVNHYTYAEENEFKPLQFFGSTLANSLLRMRYGTISNILNIIPMYAGLLRSLRNDENLRKGIVKKNLLRLPTLSLKFLFNRKKSKAHFSFHGWDYELCRDGAFYTTPENVDTNHSSIVSIIIRTYPGREYWLSESIMSVLNQTYNGLEIIVVEDGGNTHEAFVRSLQSKYPIVKFEYRALPKHGRCYSANIALEIASGDFIGFLDDDDLFFSDHVEVCVNELVAKPHLGGVYALAWEVETKMNSDRLEDGYEEVSHKTEAALREEFNRDVLRVHNLFPIQAILFRRELYEKHGGLDIELDNLEDWNLWVRYSSQDEFKLIHKTTSMYRTPHSISDRLRRQKTLDEYLPIALEKNQEYLASLEVSVSTG